MPNYYKHLCDSEFSVVLCGNLVKASANYDHEYILKENIMLVAISSIARMKHMNCTTCFIPYTSVQVREHHPCISLGFGRFFYVIHLYTFKRQKIHLTLHLYIRDIHVTTWKLLNKYVFTTYFKILSDF